ncbi:hypothetical protein HIM_08870 [Hirsutella minnesotensis 3608]|uniref:U1-type domain-containing protein n=1 Tax=Hirsutella minnesotensis 3608 TaxID=1043627 RepID=A0A0F7ZSP6_9HYPO|nr:hypothetical protein HIM_08870 [Hirsutella minnesotensis 3608]
MSEHWKSTPKYWCKYCSCYVRDTKLERQNHEATARHQGALKRSLRELHRTHEREERDKERAKHEIARLNGVVTGNRGAFQPGTSSSAAPAVTTEAERKRQREQLAELGVAIPSDMRPEMAMAGDWTVTSTRVIEEIGPDGSFRTEAVATGVRKREEATEEQKEEEEAFQRLFKKPRKWGRDSKSLAQDDDAELDALLSSTTIPIKTKTESDDAEELEKEQEPPEGHVKQETANGVEVPIKEEDEGGTNLPRDQGSVQLKAGPDSVESAALRNAAVKEEAGEKDPAPVVFKKRKPKGVRAR